MLKVKAEPIKGKDLEPGDIFSCVGPAYWDDIDSRLSIGEKVYIRTNAPAKVANDSEELIYRITLETI